MRSKRELRCMLPARRVAEATRRDMDKSKAYA